MTNIYSEQTKDGFVAYSNGNIEYGLMTNNAMISAELVDKSYEYDVIIIGAGFSGLIAARELSHRDYKVLILEARDRIGGRTMTAEVEQETYEMGGAWIHWSQPHIWTEITRYGLSITETKGTWPDHVHVLLDEASRLKIISMRELWPKLCDAMNEFHNVDGVYGRTVLPLPHTPLEASENLKKYDRLSMQDRLTEMGEYFATDKDMKQIMDAYTSQNSQCSVSEGGFLDHLRWWALGDFESERLFDKTSRFKIKGGTGVLANAILNDFRNVRVLLSTPVISIDRNRDDCITVNTQNGTSFRARTMICTVPLNVVAQIKFDPPLPKEKQRVFNEGQCRGGTKFTAKLETPVGSWFGLAPYPNAITQAFTDDTDGTIIIGFGPDGLLDIKDFNTVEKELAKFLPEIKVKHVVGLDWRTDPYVNGTWSWFRPGQMSSNLEILQKHEPPVFFASSDISNGWRGFIDGAFDSGLSTVHQVLAHLADKSNKS